MTPKERTAKLSSIPLNKVTLHHNWLRECFKEELEFRLTETDSDEWDDKAIDNIYHCALLLHLISDVADVPLMFSAKCSGDMDLGIGVDWEFLFVRDPEVLIAFSRKIQRSDIEDWINGYTMEYYKSDMKQWLYETVRYHRSAA